MSREKVTLRTNYVRGEFQGLVDTKKHSTSLYSQCCLGSIATSAHFASKIQRMWKYCIAQDYLKGTPWYNNLFPWGLLWLFSKESSKGILYYILVSFPKVEQQYSRNWELSPHPPKQIKVHIVKIHTAVNQIYYGVCYLYSFHFSKMPSSISSVWLGTNLNSDTISGTCSVGS